MIQKDSSPICHIYMAYCGEWKKLLWLERKGLQCILTPGTCQAHQQVFYTCDLMYSFQQTHDVQG